MTQLMIKNRAISPPVLLAPLAGITDLPFRNLVLSFGAGLVVSEMIASHDVVNKRPDALAKAELGFGSSQTSVQIAGREAALVAEAARICEGEGAGIIDFNMGCPAKQITNGYAGSALMQNPDKAIELVSAAVEAVKVPVTLKMRLGWDEGKMTAPEIAKRAEEAGVQMITVHGRTRCQFYNGSADWAAINKTKQAVSIPVVANGDIVDIASSKRALAQSGANGVMIGRGARGRPWLLAEIAAEIFGTTPPIKPRGQDLVDMISGHYESIVSFYGPILGNRNARKHLGWYMDEMGTNSLLRREILTEKNSSKVLEKIRLLPSASENEAA